MDTRQTVAYIGIGGNLGDARATVEQAIARLAGLPDSRLLRTSSLYRTAPVDSGGDDYVNAVSQISTSLAPLELLYALQRIELDHGRERPYRNAPRTLDLDLLLYGELRIDSAELCVPHPRMAQRAFVLAPLLDIEPAIDIPGIGAAQACLARIVDQPISKL
ncbi:2-amino-4-hydroxy-6-hydroxymethyldihydropteridine diphosphokinase [Herbaspirillum sp. WKF16]|jgi:2-amino-4-hydroxy-6-hydroxymethyldihydropteridine diphosphokinase|uniref:2-amino-4-hydroxy-6- hydroxymethyldihydropteridine diphosphokinase n=1 Tax=Herbaspirillum sp. WKF16 TaxID=3028312 RepID=UPI0023A96078|nr:2-amino-4-hydroxy-6-hydroxymethyldihydropteridine diphosphokinase [Herbaspirillum sp. WKF16]WDZ96811.1 2-amino-4-hydroxy-6-hydroxymethyldihydropteridine diphosphokinase [Herbaspirillum sp. WKF16]